MIPRCQIGKGVTGAVRYILGEGRHPETGQLRKLGPDQRSRVEWFGGVNFGFPIESREDADLARRIMEFDALNQTSRTRRCEMDCVHLSVNWRPGEKPTREQMEVAALDALKSIGMGNAKALFSAHNDEDYAHVHIVASKINPDTGRAYDLKGNYLLLSRWAEAYEEKFSGGIICLRRVEANRLRDAIAARNAGAVLALMTEQRATFTARDLERILRKQIKAPLARAQFGEAVLTQTDAVRLGSDDRAVRYSTRQVLEAEAHVLRAARELTDTGGHGAGDRARASVLSSAAFDGVSREQVLAVRHATGAESLALIDGQAGTGKSFTMAAIRQVYERERYTVIGLAPTNAVAQDMQQDGFAIARTVHAELFRLNNGRSHWDSRTVVMVDEAAMIDTRNMAMLTTHAYAAGAKLILVGDDRQLSSIQRGGMFGVLKDRYGAAELATVRRQHKHDDRRAAELMAEGNFHTALEIYDAKRAIHWTRTQPEARAALVAQWALDSAANRGKSRFIFAYTNDDVDRLNWAIRAVRKQRGELAREGRSFETSHGRTEFSPGDRIQFTGTDKPKGLFNGQAGTVRAIDGTTMTVTLDRRWDRVVAFDAAEFRDFRHGYAGTIYRGQGRTLDQTYLYHSEHWRSAPTYVALTRHRDKAELFVATNTAKDLKTLARQMARVDERRAASHFRRGNAEDGLRPLSPRELAARIAAPPFRRDPVVEARIERRNNDPGSDERKPTGDPGGRTRGAAGGEGTPPASGRTAHPRTDHGSLSSSREMGDGGSSSAPNPANTTERQRKPPARATENIVTPLHSSSQDGANRPFGMPEKQATEPFAEEALRTQQEREAEALRILQAQDERLQAFKRQKEREAEEAREKEKRLREGEARRAMDGDIASAQARYGIALAENYDIRDPYGSLARAAMHEYGAFHRQQERLRREIANERDPEQRRLLELRRNIEAHDYMAITSERLAGISAVIAGRENAPQALRDRESAAAYQARAKELREERTRLIEECERRSRDADRSRTVEPPVRQAEIAKANDNAREDALRARVSGRKEGEVELTDAKHAKIARLRAMESAYTKHDAEKQKQRERDGGGRSR